MDDLKRFILPDRKKASIVLGLLCVAAIAWILFVINHFKDSFDVIFFVLAGELMLSPYIILFIYGLIRYPKRVKELDQLFNTPEAQEDISKDFREAREFWKGDVRIGERNIYAHGKILQRNEGSFFSYKMEGQRLYNWVVYLKYGIEEIRVLSRDTLFTSEEDIRNEVEIANWYLSELDGIKEETRV